MGFALKAWARYYPTEWRFDDRKQFLKFTTWPKEKLHGGDGQLHLDLAFLYPYSMETFSDGKLADGVCSGCRKGDRGQAVELFSTLNNM
jgi:hypothetical protein